MSEDRKFGLAVGSVLLVAGAALAFRAHPGPGAVAGAAGLALVLLGAAAPARLAPVRRRWMAFAGLLGRVNTFLFLAVVFYLVLTPLGVALRIAGRDELARRRRRSSAWVPYPERNRDPRHFEKMF